VHSSAPEIHTHTQIAGNAIINLKNSVAQLITQVRLDQSQSRCNLAKMPSGQCRKQRSDIRTAAPG